MFSNFIHVCMLCHLCHFVLEYPLNNPITIELIISIWVRSLGNLKSFFHLSHQVDISIYLIEATAVFHSRELASLTPICCPFIPISLLTSWTWRSISFHLPYGADNVDFNVKIMLVWTWERENYRIWAYLSLIQHKSHEIVCNRRRFLSFFIPVESTPQFTLNLSNLTHLKYIGHKPTWLKFLL